MLHPDVEVRVGEHQIFLMLLVLSSSHPCHGFVSLQSGYICEPKYSNTAFASSSITALLEKLRREKHKNNILDDYKERDVIKED